MVGTSNQSVPEMAIENNDKSSINDCKTRIIIYIEAIYKAVNEKAIYKWL